MCAFGAVAFGIVVFVRLIFGIVIPQIRRNEKLYVAVVMNLTAALCKSGNGVSEAECHVRVRLNNIAVDQFDGVIADDGTGRIRSGVLRRRVCYNAVLQSRRRNLYARLCLVVLQPYLVLHFPFHPVVGLAGRSKE